MTQEEKQLLLKDLCARLPYGVKVYFEKTGEILPLADISQSHMFPLNDIEILLNKKYLLQWCKPYLRPMSSMTEEEKLVREKLRHEVIEHLLIDRLIDFYNSRHLDWRGLILINLALETPENMYKV